MADRGHPVEVELRKVIRTVLSLTCETNTDLGRAIGLSGALVGRRLSGTTQWSVPELGKIATHWGIPPSCLLSDLSDVLTALPEDRVAQLRAAKGHQPVHFKPPVTAVVAA
ncbi:helix-turn-helix domain-containing protein (plasmid) [Actinacidiphila glaucinigra]|uniref:helix-turn-helix domain-containing protein n=1 Tax=Actinacidiphila glaucinigra TaxID=235986 RepID=UPI002DD92BE9|nr:helix-turn-helix domain-containing protein [Actinacidiphila glaucinigra]WSD65736.1 helix-turn-helix domain-containing protein [Actinacidiphila glaucinigra]WSD65976.1 helix-turn-helix domain-containing protein [Actinacidiphila glaucinigra]